MFVQNIKHYSKGTVIITIIDGSTHDLEEKDLVTIYDIEGF